MANASISISILADAKNAARNIDQINKKLGSITGVAGKVGGALKGAIAGAGLAIGFSAVKQGFTDIVSAGSNLQQSTGAIEAVFGKQADQMKQYGSAAAQNLGLSKNSYQELATVLGAGLKNQGIEDFAGQTQKVIGLGGDLAAQFGGSTKDAVEAIGSLMRGEADPIERYGVGIKQSAVSALLAAEGNDKLTGSAKTQAEAQARLKLLFEQTTSAQGAFAREANTYAGATARNAAAFENLKAALGTALLPLLTRFQTFIANSLPGIIAFGKELATKLGPSFTSLGATLSGALPGALSFLKTTFITLSTVIATLAPIVVSLFQGFIKHKDAILALAAGLAVLVVGFKALQLAQAVASAGGFLKFILGVTKATKTWSIVQGVLNVVMSANPLALIIIAIAAFVAVVVIAYKKSETFRKIVQSAWAGIKSVTSSVFGWFKTFIPAVFNTVVNLVKGYVNLQLTIIKGVWSAIKAVTSATWSAIKGLIINPIKSAVATVGSAFESMRSSIANKISAIKTKISEIKTAVTNTFNGLKDRMFTIGQNIIQGLINGIQGMIGRVTGLIGDLASNIKSKITGALGINSPSTVFKGYGKNIGQGLIIGIESQKRDIVSSVGEIGRVIERGWSTPSLGIDSGAAAMAGGGGTVNFITNQVTVEVAAGADPAQTGREIRYYLDAYDRAAGKK